MRPGVTWGAAASGVLIAGLLAFPLVVRAPYPQQAMILVFEAATMGVAWNVIGGYAGQPALGNALFFGLGAYTSSVLLLRLHLSPWAGVALGILVACAVAWVTGYPCFRLRGHYFAIATLAISLIALQLFRTWGFVGASPGLQLPILPEGLATLQFHSSKAPYYYLFLGLMLVSLLASRTLRAGKVGYYLRALRADEEAAASVGVSVTRYKMHAYILSATLSAAMGGFYVHLTLFVDPDSVFSPLLSIEPALVTMLGGIGTLWGPVVGSAILTGLGEYTRVTFGGTGRAADLIIYGVLIVLFTVFEPNGLAGLARRVGRAVVVRR